MKKTPLQQVRTTLRNIALVVESHNRMPRWFAFVRVAVGAPLATVMMWAGFTAGENNPFAFAVGLLGAGTMLGLCMMVVGGILTANFWRKLERMRSAASGQAAHLITHHLKNL